MSKNYEACLVIGAEIKDFKYGLFNKGDLEDILSLDEGGLDCYGEDESLDCDHLDWIFKDLFGECPDFFGEYDFNWFVGKEVFNEDTLNVDYLTNDLNSDLEFYQSGIDCITKERGLIKFEVRVIKKVF